MKKNWIAVLLMSAMLVMFSGCNSDEASSGETPTVTSAKEETVEKSEPETIENEALQLGATYSTSNLEISFSDVYITKDSSFSSSSGNGSTTYMAFGPADENSFVVVEATVKNISKQDIDVLNNDPFTVQVEYAGDYKYDSDQLRGESPITPLMSATEWCLTEVPDEVVNGTESLVAYITVGSATYTYTIR